MDAAEAARKKDKQDKKKEQKRLAAAAAASTTGTSTATTSAISSPAPEVAATTNGTDNTAADAEAARKLAKKEKKAAKAAKKAEKADAADSGSTSKKDKKRKLDEDESATAAPAQDSVNHADMNGAAPNSISSDKTAAPAAVPNGEDKPKKKRKKDVKGAFGNAAKKAKPDETATTDGDSSVAAESSVAPSSSKASKKLASSSASKLSKAEVDEFLTSSQVSYEPEGSANTYPPILAFNHLPVSDGIKSGLKNFAKPTIVQSASWGVQLRPEQSSRARDCVAIASTGSGKTLAFGVPILHHILALPKSKNVTSLIVAPTRELAIQTQNNLGDLGKSLDIGVVCIYGGASKGDQKRQLSQGPRIVVGTPGRILDLANEGDLDLSHVSWLVLDEADRMLDKGFENDIRNIIGQCKQSNSTSEGRITSMFSATWPMSVRRLASDFMIDPIRITVGSEELMASASVSQSVIVLPDSRSKDYKLRDTLRGEGFAPVGGYTVKGKAGSGTGTGAQRDKVLVFALYKKEAARVATFLERGGYEVACIQGDMTQDKREQSLNNFKTGVVNVLVATDVAARGLDIPRVELVINYTFPLTIEDYVHRVGRTGRAGRKGKAITFFTEDDKAHAGELQRVLKDGGHPVPEELQQFGGTIKKKSHAAYGDHFKEIDPNIKAKKITFDD